MTEQELNKLLSKKQKELQQLQAELHALKFDKQIKAILEAIQQSDNVLSVISEHNLNVEDCRFIGERIAADFIEIYKTCADEITKKQARRERKRNQRKANTQRKKDDAKYADDFIDRLLNQASSSSTDTTGTPDVSVADINESSDDTAEVTGRTY